MIAAKQKPDDQKSPRTKRIVIELPPAVRGMLDAYVNGHNEGPERVASPLKYTDVINLALDAFLPNKPNLSEAVTSKKEKKPGKDRKAKPGKAGKPV